MDPFCVELNCIEIVKEPDPGTISLFMEELRFPYTGFWSTVNVIEYLTSKSEPIKFPSPLTLA